MTPRLPKTAPAPQWLSAVNAVVVRAVLRFGVLSTPGLRAQVMDVLGVEPTANAFGRRLRWLRDGGWLANTSATTHTGRWRLTPAAASHIAVHGLDWLPARLDGALPPRDHTAERAPARRPASTGPLAPPPRRNVLHGPTWQPPRWEPARAGADDHRQYATRGVRC